MVNRDGIYTWVKKILFVRGSECVVDDPGCDEIVSGVVALESEECVGKRRS
jgi:hypothetical protein